jgi:hypothetical protein
MADTRRPMMPRSITAISAPADAPASTEWRGGKTRHSTAVQNVEMTT